MAPVLLRCLPGVSPGTVGGEKEGELFNTSILGSPRWAMVGWFRPPGTGEPPISGSDETLF